MKILFSLQITSTLFVGKILKIVRDTIVITEVSIGAKFLPFLKIWGLIPATIFCIFFVSLLLKRKSYKISYLTLSVIFGGIFIFYTWLLVPYSHTMNALRLAFILREFLPRCFEGVILIFELWPITVFYVFSELWIIVMLTIMFWKYIGDILTIEQGKEIFPLFSLDISGILVGPLFFYLRWITNGQWFLQCQLLNTVILIMIIFLVILMYVIQIQYPINTVLNANKQDIDELYPCNNLYLLSLAAVVFLFELTDNLFDIFWKNLLGIYLSNPIDFSIYLANTTTLTGVGGTLFIIFFSKYFLKNISWLIASLVTPMIFSITTSIFFLSFLFEIPLENIVFIGAIQTCLISISKQTLFDNTRDLAILAVPLKERYKIRKLSDALSSRLGKSAGNIIYQLFLILELSLSNIFYVIILFFSGYLPIWIFSIKYLNSRYKKFISN